MLSKNLIAAAAAALALVPLAGCRQSPAMSPGGGAGSGGSAGGPGATSGAPDMAGGMSSPTDLATTPPSDLPGGLLYDIDGPETYAQQSMTAPGNIAVNVWVPSTAGPRPLVVVSSGLQQPAAAYAPYARRLASWGIVAVTRDDPGVLAQTQSVANDIATIVGWLPSALPGRIDAARVGLAGHSRGGMASLLAAEGGLHGKLAGFFGIDPVDNMGAAASGLGSVAIPSVFLGETTDSGGDMGGMACAPADQNYAVLYAAAPSPSLSITAVGADHTEFEDPASCSFCTFCTKGTADGATVLRYSTRLLMAFFARELLADTRLDATLAAARSPADDLTLQAK